MNPTDRPEAAGPEWTFLSNHAHVLLVIAREPGVRQRDLADRVGITERAVQRIVADLETAGYLVTEKQGRRNSYRVIPTLPLRHPVEAHCSVSSLLALVLGEEELTTMSATGDDGEKSGRS